MKYDTCPWINDLDTSFKVFHELMTHKVWEILLVLSPYDAFIMEEDASLSTRIINEFRGLNLSRPPRMTRVSTAEEALELVRSKKFNLVITLPQVGDMDSNTLGLQIKGIDPELPVILLAHSQKSITPVLSSGGRKGIDNFFIWSPDPALMLSIIKNVEDHQNVDKDTSLAMVRVLILVEDSPLYRSFFLPLLYQEVVAQTQAVLDESLNEEHRLLKMRARPKILVAENFEEAMTLYHEYQPYVFALFADTSFPKKGRMVDKAGLELLHHIRAEITDLPLLLMSAESKNAEKAREIPASFLDKNSPTIGEEIHNFFLDHLGFGDFVFHLPDGTEIDRACNLQTFEKKLAQVPEECLIFHTENNHFSNWIMARSEIGLASRLHKSRIANLDDVKKLRHYLIDQVHTLRCIKQQGVVAHFAEQDFDAEVMNFVKIGHGSMGGKALGLAFMADQLHRAQDLHEKYPQIDISIPPTLVITTEAFGTFIRENSLQGTFEKKSDVEIADIFLNSTIPEWLEKQLATFLQQVKEPLTVRSSSLLEDSMYKPYAGLYETYMLPNDHADVSVRLEQLLNAVKLVYASTYFAGPRAFSSVDDQSSRKEGMAVIVQLLAGSYYGDYFYPVISGVAKSHNYYPIGEMKPADGIAQIALGFGKTVVEGEKSLIFSPKFPENLPQFSTVDEMLANSQTSFYALRMQGEATHLDYKQSNLERRQISEAEDESPVQTMASTYSPEEHRIRDSFGSGTKVLTFARILKHKIIPLPELLTDLLELGHQGMSADIEIEFAVELTEEGRKNRFHFLQIRPMVSGGEQLEVKINKKEINGAICFSSQPLGHGINDTIADIVYVKPADFNAKNTLHIAREIGRLNANLKKDKRPYLLIGPGRWGSADPWLGIPVRWEDISGVGAMIELHNDQLSVENSQGTHFFQNITSLGIKYCTVNEIDKDSPDFLNWQWLASLHTAEETKNLRHVQLVKPLLIKVDSSTSQCIMTEKQSYDH
jgi:DNA-binding NarL/FixJ family response regulator